MAQNPANITVPGQFRMYVAPVGTAAPADSAAALGAAWVEVGYTTEDGSSFATDPAFEEVRSHQSDFPTRLLKTGDTATVGAVLQEFSRRNFEVAFGGGTITTIAAGQYRYDPPATGVSVPVAVLLEIVDGSKVYRFVVPKARNRSGVDLGLNKTSEAGLPVELTVEGAAGTSPWYVLTNDPAFA